MSQKGYYRYPALAQGRVYFVSEDDLWVVPAEGGAAQRLTANLGTILSPHVSPDGTSIAFTGREEGHHEVYLMPSEGGQITRLTYLGASTNAIGWTPDGAEVILSTNFANPHGSPGEVYSIAKSGGLPRRWKVGYAFSIAMQDDNRMVIGRNNLDPARWKRYKGGTAGDIWIDSEGQGNFRRLLQLNANVARPMWIGDRIYFLADHEGVGNIYSCDLNGDDIQRHTERTDFYVRHPNTDGERIVYHAGASLYLYDPKTNEDRQIEVGYASPRVQRQRRFVNAERYLETASLHPKGHSLAITSRGKSFVFGNWEGAVVQQGGENSPIRYRLTRWLNDGKRVVTLTDDDGDERMVVFAVSGNNALEEPKKLAKHDFGRPIQMKVSPTADMVALTNHRNELILVDLEKDEVQVIDKSLYSRIAGFDWSHDGTWIAYGFPGTQYTTCIKLWEKASGTATVITEPVLHDSDPAFDPEGKYLYFLGQRILNPVYDSLHFDLGFPRGMKPYLITLRADLPSPFVQVPRPLKDEAEEKPKKSESAETAKPESGDTTNEENEPAKDTPKPLQIDLDGITKRVVAFPLPEGIYHQISGAKGRVLFTMFPVEGAIKSENSNSEKAKGVLEYYDLKELKRESLMSGVSHFSVAQDRQTVLVACAKTLRVISAMSKPDEKAGETPSRKSGYIDLDRVKVSIEPGIEWRQMAREAWRLQRDHFWTADMSKIDWDDVWNRYEPLIDRIGTRGEFSDLLWEIQGELGTSHAYEMGGDYRPEPTYPVGHLGAELQFDEASETYRIERIINGDSGDEQKDSPLNLPGINIKVGDTLLAVNGRRLSKQLTPQMLLVNMANQEIILTVKTGEDEPRSVTVKTLRSESAARYREWVERNRRYVHERTNGRVGYVHIPDMGAHGYAEFHRLYLAEVDRDGLIVDVRYNRGGHVSQLLIEKLARKRVGYDFPRWGQPEPYPDYSVAGPIVAMTNQFAGSDGDIFSHVFKMKKLGTLIGKRTWGGVIGIWPRHSLADGSVTTQPEFSFWFQDVGWGVENYGTDPDIDIDIAPQDYGNGHDPQMEKALEVILTELETYVILKPEPGARPNLAPPSLTPRTPEGTA